MNKTLTSGKNHSGLEAWNVLLPSERMYVVVVDAVKVKSTMYIDDTQNAATVAIYPRCADPYRRTMRVIGEEQLNGFNTYVYESEQTTSPGMRNRIKEWLAQDIDCRPLKYIRESLTEDGQVSHKFERNALSIIIGEPDPILFVVPAGYREVPPSQANRELVELKTRQSFDSDPKNARLLKGMERMDQKYWESQKFK